MNSSDSSAAPAPAPSARSNASIENYYRWHARVYDATRWSFLFGRDAVLDRAARARPAPARVLEIGCGTGRNLARLAQRFPHAQLTGLDLAAPMLAVARKRTATFGSRVTLVQRAYDSALAPDRGYDLVICSYALSMFNPGFERALAAARDDLAPGGVIGLVDFHTTRFHSFSRWMGINHVRMDGQLRPLLRASFVPVLDELRAAYFGVWHYLIYVGSRKS